MSNGRTVENESKRKEEPLSPSPTLLHFPYTLIFVVDIFMFRPKLGLPKCHYHIYLEYYTNSLKSRRNRRGLNNELWVSHCACAMSFELKVEYQHSVIFCCFEQECHFHSN
jgi:hypothetical protein